VLFLFGQELDTSRVPFLGRDDLEGQVSVLCDQSKLRMALLCQAL
jgi:hypothetical protein